MSNSGNGAKVMSPIASPFTGEELMAVPVLNPDVTIVHAQQTDRRGNVALWALGADGTGLRARETRAAGQRPYAPARRRAGWGRIIVSGRALDGVGEPVPDATLEIWQADAEGRQETGFGRSGTDADGRFEFVTVNSSAEGSFNT